MSRLVPNRALPYRPSHYGVWEWSDIVAIAAGQYHTVGLKSDGTVVAVGDNLYGQCEVSDWTDIVAVTAGDTLTVGLKSDGTLVIAGHIDIAKGYEQEWSDIGFVR